MEDLRRHLAHLPLAHLREPSPAERCRKWLRRHPQVVSAGGVAGVALLVALTLAGLALARGRQIARFEARLSPNRRRLLQATLENPDETFFLSSRALARRYAEQALKGLTPRELARRFPPGLEYAIAYDTTPFIRESVAEVFHTLRDAVILVSVGAGGGGGGFTLFLNCFG